MKTTAINRDNDDIERVKDRARRWSHALLWVAVVALAVFPFPIW